jgi:hypothetical protein
MTSYRQIEANRRNALNSTGPRTEAGKQQSRRNAVRHGLTAETVIGVLEDAEDYRQFETTVIADYDAQSAVERQLVLRLASVLWRLRRATTVETGLFEIQAEHLREYRQGRHLLADSRDAIQAAPEGTHLVNYDRRLSESRHEIETLASSQMETDGFPPEFARCFLRLANLPNFALDRLSRYEAGLWRQVRQILFTRTSESVGFCLAAKTYPAISNRTNCCRARGSVDSVDGGTGRSRCARRRRGRRLG